MALFSLPSLYTPNPVDPYTQTLNYKLIFSIVGVVVALLAAFIAMTAISTVGTSSLDNFESMIAQEQFLTDEMTNAQSHIQNEALAKTNIEAITLFSSDIYMMTQQLSSKYNVSAVPTSVATAATDSSVDTRLSNAQSLGTYDSTLRDIVRQKIASLLTLAGSMQHTFTDDSYAQAINKFTSDLQITDAELKAINF